MKVVKNKSLVIYVMRYGGNRFLHLRSSQHAIIYCMRKVRSFDVCAPCTSPQLRSTRYYPRQKKSAFATWTTFSRWALHTFLVLCNPKEIWSRMCTMGGYTFFDIFRWVPWRYKRRYGVFQKKKLKDITTPKKQIYIFPLAQISCGCILLLFTYCCQAMLILAQSWNRQPTILCDALRVFLFKFLIFWSNIV